MSLTITSNIPATELNPVYSPMWIVLTSTQSNEPDFKYVFYVNTINPVTLTDNSNLATVKLFPSSDGSGIFSPARILESQISFDYDFFATGFTTNPNSLLLYKVKFGEEYTVTGVTFSSTTNNGGYVQYNFSGTPSPAFIVGDVVKIEKYLKNINLDYDGLQTITAVDITGATITTDKVFGVASSIESGECVSRLTIQTGITSTGTCINFARQYNQGLTDFASAYYLADSNSNYLIDYDNTVINIGSNQVHSLSGVEKLSAVTAAYVFTYSGSNYAPHGLFIVSKSASPYDNFTFHSGTYNLRNTYDTNTYTSAVEPIVTDITTKYLISFVSGVNDVSEDATFFIRDFCGPSDVRLSWLNEKGAWSYFNFNKKQKRKLDIKREYVNKVLDWNYNVGDSEQLVIGTKVDEVITINTDWITQAEASAIESLFTSPQVYYLVNSNEQAHPVVILSKDFEGKSYENNELINYSIEFAFAYHKQLQRN